MLGCSLVLKLFISYVFEFFKAIFLLQFKIANLLFQDALILFAVSQLSWASVEYSQDFLALEFLGYDYRLEDLH